MIFLSGDFKNMLNYFWLTAINVTEEADCWTTEVARWIHQEESMITSYFKYIAPPLHSGEYMQMLGMWQPKCLIIHGEYLHEILKNICLHVFYISVRLWLNELISSAVWNTEVQLRIMWLFANK